MSAFRSPTWAGKEAYRGEPNEQHCGRFGDARESDVIDGEWCRLSDGGRAEGIQSDSKDSTVVQKQTEEGITREGEER